MFKPYHKVYLKVKIKSLAEEARIIRLEEKRSYINAQREGLYLHRVIDVRMEARASQLAYAYLRGVPVQYVEPNSKDTYFREDVYRRAASVVKKFGTKDAVDGFSDWLQNRVEQ